MGLVVNDPKIILLPPGKAYGYDRTTLNERDQVLFDWALLDDHYASRERRSFRDMHEQVFDPRDEP